MRAASLSLLWGETVAASAFVVGTRTAMLYRAASGSRGADLSEIGRFVPEKADALYRGLSDMGRARDPLDAAERLLRPIHHRVTANARRLRRAG